MTYVWTDEMATGNAVIDTQHKQLVKALNDLLDACSSGHGRSSLNTTLNFLIDYVVKHFRDEEILQQKSNYPDYDNHKKLHDTFKETVSDLARRLKSEGPTISLVAKVNTSLGSWFMNHLQCEDKKVAMHICTSCG